MTTGDRIKQLRIEKHMSQEELGEKVGVQKAAINKYETGLVVNLKRSTIAKLAAALDVTPAYLMGWEDTEPAPEPQEMDKSDLKIALWNGEKGMTDAQLAEVMQFVAFVKARDEKK